MSVPTPPQSVLRELLDYDPRTGLLVWRHRAMHWFASADQHPRWNSRCAGKPALGSSHQGYRYLTLLGGKYLAHRVIWKWMTGEEPDFIDHIDGDRANNRWSNLRSVCHLENCKNAARPTNGTSGHVGVSAKSGRSGVWYAYIYQNGRQIALGNFRSFEAACEARRRAEADLGFHPNHGRPAVAYPR